jgi:limonene-1,2-epoxide hydrolase
MPWFPEFVSAVELVRRQTSEAGHDDPVAQYLSALSSGDSRRLEDVWPGRIVVFDPRAGEVHGHRQLRHFVQRNMTWLAEHDARVETVATTTGGGRAVVELLAYLDGAPVAWPVAVVAESPDESSVIFRSYCSQMPVDGRRHIRPPILTSTAELPGDVVGQFQAALAAGDAEALVRAFMPDGYYREPIGIHETHRGAEELRSFFGAQFASGSSGNGDRGIQVQPCVVTDDTVRCAVEYTLLRWGSAGLPPQAGIAVYERGADGLLAAVRVYDDIEPPDVRNV